MQEHFELLVRCTAGGIALGLVAAVLSFGFSHVSKVLHTFFTP